MGILPVFWSTHLSMLMSEINSWHTKALSYSSSSSFKSHSGRFSFIKSSTVFQTKATVSNIYTENIWITAYFGNRSQSIFANLEMENSIILSFFPVFSVYSRRKIQIRDTMQTQEEPVFTEVSEKLGYVDIHSKWEWKGKRKGASQKQKDRESEGFYN